MQPQITIEEFQRFAEDEIPLVPLFGIRTEAIGYGTANLRLTFNPRLTRPGGTVSGPAMMGLADVALYAALLGQIGPRHHAVTTSFTANFLRKPGPADLLCEARILKAGKRLAYGECSLRSDGEDDLVAHVTGTYSIPPR